MNNLREKMKWYHSHQTEVLHYTHQHLVNFDVASIQKMSRSTMLEYIELLNTARIFYETETSQLATNQSTIHSWIDRHSSIAQRVRSNPRQRNNPNMIDSNHSDSTQECEFDWQPQSWIDIHGSIAQRVQSRRRSTWESDYDWSDSTWESDSDWEPFQTTNVQRDAAQITQIQRDQQSMTERIIWDTGD